MEILKKHTVSLCPQCKREIGAQVYGDNGRVLMRKSCPDHGTVEALVEKDVDFYRRVMHDGPDPDSQFDVLIMPVTYRCNMKCRYCYLPDAGQQDIPLSRIVEIISGFSGGAIALSGGEPTLRHELPEIIEHICRIGKQAWLVTNGLRLDDPDYVATLKASGLNRIFFALNGFSSRSDADIHDRTGVTERKLRALDNLRGRGFEIVLSATIGRGINDDEMIDLFEYAVRNADSVIQLRLRGVTKVGRYGEDIGFFNSELVRWFSHSTGITREHMFEHLTDANACNTNYHFMIRLYFRFVENRFEILPNLTKSNYGEHAGPLRKVATLWRELGARGVAEELWKLKFRPKNKIRNLHVRFISWPNIDNIDLQEADRGTAHLYGQGQILNFCHAIVLNDHL